MNMSVTTTYAKLSVISITVTAIITAVHHIYREGWVLLIPGALVVLLPLVLVRWFSASGSNIALSAYGVLNALIIVGLGIVDGFLDHVLNAFIVLFAATRGEAVDRLDRAFRVLPQTPLVGDMLYELTGILTFVASMIAAYYWYRFMRATLAERMSGPGQAKSAVSRA
jgi:hypothetical protein